MLTRPARPLILTLGALLALFDLVVLLPGNPDFTSAGGFLIAVVVQALIVWRLLHRSNRLVLRDLGSLLYTASFVLIRGAVRDGVHDQCCVLV